MDPSELRMGSCRMEEGETKQDTADCVRTEETLSATVSSNIN